jgi:hypothetical protein
VSVSLSRSETCDAVSAVRQKHDLGTDITHIHTIRMHTLTLHAQIFQANPTNKQQRTQQLSAYTPAATEGGMLMRQACRSSSQVTLECTLLCLVCHPQLLSQGRTTARAGTPKRSTQQILALLVASARCATAACTGRHTHIHAGRVGDSARATHVHVSAHDTAKRKTWTVAGDAKLLRHRCTDELHAERQPERLAGG